LLPVTSEWISGLGTRVKGRDTIEMITNNQKPYFNGTLEWRIPQLFQVGIGDLVTFSTSIHYATTDSAGNATISKKDSVVGIAVQASAALSDPNQFYGD
jgi:hypothetical protein